MVRAFAGLWLSLFAVVACSSGSTGTPAADAARPDAVIDAPIPDAAVASIDARPIDAVFLPIDARPIDARPIDAVPIDAPPIDAVPIDAPGLDASVGASCGGRGSPPCTGNIYCDWDDDSCGATDLSGICTIRPDVCDQTVARVCACDGQVYTNACIAAASGSDVKSMGGCAVPPGFFACGPTYCATGAEFCQAVVGGAAGSSPHYSCDPIPAECKPATCTCLKMHACGSLCSADRDGNFTLTCQAP